MVTANVCVSPWQSSGRKSASCGGKGVAGRYRPLQGRCRPRSIPDQGGSENAGFRSARKKAWMWAAIKCAFYAHSHRSDDNSTEWGLRSMQQTPGADRTLSMCLPKRRARGWMVRSTRIGKSGFRQIVSEEPPVSGAPIVGKIVAVRALGFNRIH